MIHLVAVIYLTIAPNKIELESHRSFPDIAACEAYRATEESVRKNAELEEQLKLHFEDKFSRIEYSCQ